MTPQEKQHVDDLFDRLSQLESSPRDPQALASAIRELASEGRNAYGERSRRARARIVEQFSLERSVSRWLESYAALLALPASRSLPGQEIS